MEIKNKLNIGDKIFYVHKIFSHEENIKCNICKERGTIHLKKVEFCCPKCDGKGYSRRPRYHWAIVRSEVRKIKIEVTASSNCVYYTGLYFNDATDLDCFKSGVTANRVCIKRNKLEKEKEKNNE